MSTPDALLIACVSPSTPESATLVTAEVVGVSVTAATSDTSIVALRLDTEPSVSSKLYRSKSRRSSAGGARLHRLRTEPLLLPDVCSNLTGLGKFSFRLGLENHREKRSRFFRHFFLSRNGKK